MCSTQRACTRHRAEFREEIDMGKLFPIRIYIRRENHELEGHPIANANAQHPIGLEVFLPCTTSLIRSSRSILAAATRLPFCSGLSITRYDDMI